MRHKKHSNLFYNSPLYLFLILLAFSSCHEEVPHTKYYPNGGIEETCYLRSGKLSGDYKKYDENGNLISDGQFRNGHPVGIWKSYYPNGNIMLIEEYNRRGNLINVNAWEEDGCHAIVNGTGTIKQYWPDGSLRSIDSYLDCRPEGVNEGWYPNGVKEHEFYYKKGRPVGTWRYWDIDGHLYKTEEH